MKGINTIVLFLLSPTTLNQRQEALDSQPELSDV